MYAEYLVVNDGSKGKVVENLCAVAPHVHTTVLAQAFIVETVHLSDLTTLVVTSN